MVTDLPAGDGKSTNLFLHCRSPPVPVIRQGSAPARKFHGSDRSMEYIGRGPEFFVVLFRSFPPFRV
jgi:hypothetical protein